VATTASLPAASRRDAASAARSILPLLVTEFQSLDYFIACTKILLAELGIIDRPDVRGTNPVSRQGHSLLLERARRADILPS
jgi:hypothetical protein